MYNSSEQIPDEIAAEVLDLAARLYSENYSSGYSLEELQQAGTEVSLPPELIKEAFEQVKLQQLRAKQKRTKLIQFSVALVFTTALWSMLVYNSCNQELNQVNAAWAQVENQLQRKIDLIPQLIDLTKAQAEHEQRLVQQLTSARQSYLVADSNSEKIEAIANINSLINSLQLKVLRDSELQSSPTFINLQNEITGTENRLATERRRYNQAVRQYNQKISSFPNNVIANFADLNPEQFYKLNTN